MSKLEPKYILFDSLEQMLALETLSKLLSRPITRVDCHPMSEHRGVAGSQLSYVDTNVGRLVLKQMSIASDWIMFASDDVQCRAVKLWQYGMLDQLHPHLEHQIIACSHDNDGWAILMKDLTDHVYSGDKPLPPQLVPVFLDRMARLHATFWNDPLLNDSRLGLCDTAKLLDQFSLPVAQCHHGQSMGVIPDWIKGGWEVMEELLDSAVFMQLSSLNENPHPLIKALGRYPYTLLHGDYRADNLAHLKPDRPVVLDWQTSGHSLMTIDLAWFTTQGDVHGGMGQEQAIGYYRGRLEANLNTKFNDWEWQAMTDVGTLVDALRSTCFSAYWYKHTEDPNERLRLEIEVKVRNHQVREAMRWL
jgi:Phosphotransferase enzyme family